MPKDGEGYAPRAERTLEDGPVGELKRAPGARVSPEAFPCVRAHVCSRMGAHVRAHVCPCACSCMLVTFSVSWTLEVKGLALSSEGPVCCPAGVLSKLALPATRWSGPPAPGGPIPHWAPFWEPVGPGPGANGLGQILTVAPSCAGQGGGGGSVPAQCHTVAPPGCQPHSGRRGQPHFTGEETEVRRREVTCPQAHGFGPGSKLAGQQQSQKGPGGSEGRGGLSARTSPPPQGYAGLSKGLVGAVPSEPDRGPKKRHHRPWSVPVPAWRLHGRGQAAESWPQPSPPGSWAWPSTCCWVGVPASRRTLLSPGHTQTPGVCPPVSTSPSGVASL